MYQYHLATVPDKADFKMSLRGTAGTNVFPWGVRREVHLVKGVGATYPPT